MLIRKRGSSIMKKQKNVQNRRLKHRSQKNVGLKLNQEQYDAALINLIIEGMLPLSFVSLDAFRKYTHCKFNAIQCAYIHNRSIYYDILLPSVITTGEAEPDEDTNSYHIISANTVKSRVYDLYTLEMKKLRKELQSVEYICSTADIWSTKHKSYLGVTIHWIDETNLKRKSRALCCRRFKYPHDNERVAEILDSINKEFMIDMKVFGTVTDNATNFAAAFKNFGCAVSEYNEIVAGADQIEMDAFHTDLNEDALEDDSSSDDSASDECSLSSDEAGDEDDVSVNFHNINDIMLPTQYRCAAHTFSLIGSKDAQKSQENVLYQSRHDIVFDKLDDLFRYCNLPKSSETIKEALGRALITPCKTRWNSVYDSILHVIKIGLPKMNAAMEKLEFDLFTKNDFVFMNEFIEVMAPIALGIDNLQRSECYYSIFLPTLHSTRIELKRLLKEKLVYCKPLVQAILDGLCRRYSRFFDIDDEQCMTATIAACLNPHFKTRWIDEEVLSAEYINKIEKKIIEEIKSLPAKNTSTIRIETTENENSANYGECG